MSLINDMLRDLDARRAHPAAGNRALLQNVSIDSRMAHRDKLRLMGGSLILVALIIAAPLITDTLEVFDWGRPGGTVTTTPIALPAQTPKRPQRAIKPVELPTRAAPRPAPTAPTPRKTASTPEEPAVAAQLEDNDPATQASSLPPDDQAPTGIVLQRTPAEHTYRQAAAAAAAGNDQAAIVQLNTLLEEHVDHLQATQLLASLYIRQQQPAKAEALLEQALARQPLHTPFARLLARLLITDQRHTAAIMRLESALPGAANDADYQALLAGLYQRTGRSADAVQHYAAALQLDAEQGEWWLGLGLSQQQLGNREAALGAYRRALQFPLDASLRDYVGKQLRQLMQTDAADAITMQSTGKG